MAKEKPNWMEDQGEGGAEVATEKRTRVKKPPLYLVILLNDDFTPMEFVTSLLQTIFYKSHEEAVRLMLDVHTKGRGICGIYPYDVARTKVFQVKELARNEGHPLECILEEE